MTGVISGEGGWRGRPMGSWVVAPEGVMWPWLEEGLRGGSRWRGPGCVPELNPVLWPRKGGRGRGW